jgi:adenosylhomocysteinase
MLIIGPTSDREPLLWAYDGGDATEIQHDRHPDLLAEIHGISEEMTTGSTGSRR